MDAIELDQMDADAKIEIDKLFEETEREFHGERQRRRQMAQKQIELAKKNLQENVLPGEASANPSEVNYGT